MIGYATPELHDAGEVAGPGSFACTDCGMPIHLAPADELPVCSNCGGAGYRRASIFERPTLDHATLSHLTEGRGDWLAEARSGLAQPGAYLAYRSDDETVLLELARGWSRIGRSPNAEIRLDDVTVSRRHAVVSNTPGGGIRALDDRSLNGMLINGERADWGNLSDGDELQLGRYRLQVIDAR